jgi:S-adenosylmethionine decarboxylase
MKKTVTFGLHLMLDAYNCDPHVLNEQTMVYQILDDLPKHIGMKQLSKPYVVFAEGNGKHDPGGWSGFVIIEESHISVHTFIRRRFITVDVYSCREFDAEKTIQYFKDKFKTTDVEVYVQKRGLKYPAENID